MEEINYKKQVKIRRFRNCKNRKIKGPRQYCCFSTWVLQHIGQGLRQQFHRRGGRIVPHPLPLDFFNEHTSKSNAQNGLLNFRTVGCHSLLKIDGWISTPATHSNRESVGALAPRVSKVWALALLFWGKSWNNSSILIKKQVDKVNSRENVLSSTHVLEILTRPLIRTDRMNISKPTQIVSLRNWLLS